MYVPELTGLSNATEILTGTSSESADAVPTSTDLNEITRTLRHLGRENRRLRASTGLPRSNLAQKEEATDKGTTVVSESSTVTSTEGSASTQASANSKSSTVSSSEKEDTSTTSASTSSKATPSVSASSAALATPAPDCPAGNGTTFSDSSQIDYKIRCNSDNTYDSFNSITVGTGGYDQCFSACSISTQCAGFTFVGIDGGTCYLKQQMPNGDYIAKNGNNYVSCAKVDPSAAKPSPSPTDAASGGAKKSNAGAVAGGVIGGIAFLALLLVLIAWIARRRRNKLEEKRATITHFIHGPIETQQILDNSNGGPGGRDGHGRSGSTAHDAFAPFGGFYRGFSSAHANRQMELENIKPAGGSQQNTSGESPHPVPPGVRAEGFAVTLPPTVYQRPSNPSADAVPMLDGRPLSQSSRGSSRFREHIAEMEDTSLRPVPGQAPPARSPKTPDTDSPTLGRDSGLSGPLSLSEQVRRKQHLMSWNSYETKLDAGDQSTGATMTPKTPPAAQGNGQAGQLMCIFTDDDLNIGIDIFTFIRLPIVVAGEVREILRRLNLGLALSSFTQDRRAIRMREMTQPVVTVSAEAMVGVVRAFDHMTFVTVWTLSTETKGGEGTANRSCRGDVNVRVAACTVCAVAT
ncbi:hypothetical protein KC367_g6051 [Hortaea werneckii]|nr:hypothetical protein KC350_g11180 [Hortaea werneckii]KAI6842205.1 hypothetical protein KC342_g1821 [Hortaea werneckii]KAI6844915.1 hypothetical protein KC358_g3601 [Hortaea werneckii]KAI7044226.1 hypothetical protein KC366_g3969 [Hortaea werneckii]KAI7045384.1 hypothetical protein KC362_g2988 [Hortaea werneckii]